MKTTEETYEDLNAWLKENESKYGHLTFHKSEFDAIARRHSQIKDFLGGTRKTKTIKVHGKECSLPDDVCKKYIEIAKSLNLGSAMFLTFAKYVKTGVVPVAAKGNHIYTLSYYMTKYIQGGHTAETKKQLSDMLSKLGKEYIKYGTNEAEFTNIISTSPKSFILLGHYGPDDMSCFRLVKDSHRNAVICTSKQSIMNMSNSFVIVTRNNDENIARCIGYTPDFKIWHCFNVYLKSEKYLGSYLENLRLLIGKLTKSSDIVMEEFEANNLRRPEFYFNPMNSHIFYDPADKKRVALYTSME